MLTCILILGIAGCGGDVQDSTPSTENNMQDSSQESGKTQIVDGKDNGSFNVPDVELEKITELIISTQVFDELIKIGYTEENATEIEKILKTVGVDSFISQTMPTTNPNDGLCPIVGYPNGYTEENRRCFFTTENGILFFAGFGTEDLYDTAQGGFLKDYSDVHVPETKVDTTTGNELQQLSIEQVESCLNYSESANFHSLDWAFGREDDKYMVLGTVTAENGFGVTDDIRFTVWFVKSDGTLTVEGVALNGIRVK